MGLSNLTAKVAAILSAIGTAILVAGIAYGLHAFTMARAEAKHKDALEAQKTALVNECNSDKSLTKGTDDEIYLNHNSIDNILANRLLDNAPTCMHLASDTRGPTTPATSGNVHGTNGSSNGVSRAELYKIAADADKVRADLLACRSFIEQTWAAKGQ